MTTPIQPKAMPKSMREVMEKHGTDPRDSSIASMFAYNAMAHILFVEAQLAEAVGIIKCMIPDYTHSESTLEIAEAFIARQEGK